MSAHPEARSLTHALRRDGIRHLQSLGHEVLESDLYAMNWNPVVTRNDAGIGSEEAFRVSEHTRQALVGARVLN